MKTIIYLTLFLVITFCGCKKDNVEQSHLYTKDKLIGTSQKGPFVNGASLTMFELDANFGQTGKSFNTQILDNSGAFEISNISLVSNYAKLKADGFYFNEVSNANSQAPITLYALSDLSNKSTVNINILTSLEVSRIEYLIGNGLNFTDAKKQAQREILTIFSIKKSDIVESELLNISQNGDDNAILLAVAIIMQGYRTESELSQLLGDINTDIRTDGVLNSQSLGTSLINDVRLMNLADIRTHIENKYQVLGVSATIPDFEKYIHLFLDSTNYTFNNFIQYPYIINAEENLLKDSSFFVTNGIQYSVGAFLPFGTSLKVVSKPTPGYGWSNGNIGYYLGLNVGWTYNNYYPDSLVFTANGINQTIYVPVMLMAPTSSDFVIYENNAVIPTRIRTFVY